MAQPPEEGKTCYTHQGHGVQVRVPLHNHINISSANYPGVAAITAKDVALVLDQEIDILHIKFCCSVAFRNAVNYLSSDSVEHLSCLSSQMIISCETPTLAHTQPTNQIAPLRKTCTMRSTVSCTTVCLQV